MKKQKTAVEWLIEQMRLRKEQGLTISFYDLEMFADKAKQIEKEQIRDAFNAGDTSSSDFFIPFLKSMDESEVYYESKYGKDENKAENND